MRLLGGGPKVSEDYLAVFHENRAHGARAGRKRLRECELALRAEVAPEEAPTFITSTDTGVIAVTPTRVLVVANGQLASAFARAAIHETSTAGSVVFTGADGALCEPVRCGSQTEAQELVAAAVLPPLVTPDTRAHLMAIGRGAFAPPYDDAASRPVDRDAFIRAADDGQPELERRLARELEAVEGWEAAGALALGFGGDVLIDCATGFLRDRAVPNALLPPAALERWADVHGAPPKDAEPLPERDLGRLLLSHGEVDLAQEAFARGEAEGDVEAIHRLAALFEDHLKDLAAAEAAWARADAAGSLNGAGNLGRLLQERGDFAGAEAAYRRCADRGSWRGLASYGGLLLNRPDAAAEEIIDATVRMCHVADHFVSDHSNMEAGLVAVVLDSMWERDDPVALESAARRADEEGSANGAYALGFMLRERDHHAALAAFLRAAERGHSDAWGKAALEHYELGEIEQALAMARNGEEAGEASAGAFIGQVLLERGDRDGALDAFRRADAGGDPHGAFNLGASLAQEGEYEAAVAAFERALERGAANAEAALRQARTLLELRREAHRRDPRPAGDRNLATARAVLVEICAAPGSQSRMEAAVERLRLASRTPDVATAVVALQTHNEDPESFKRPWRWLGAVAHQANEAGEPDLAAMAFVFTSVWHYGIRQYGPHVGWDGPTEVHLRSIAAAGLAAARRLAPDYVVATDSAGVQVRAGDLTGWPLAVEHGFS